MNKQRENIIKNTFFNLSDFLLSDPKGTSGKVFKNKIIIPKLKNFWENYLFTYKISKRKATIFSSAVDTVERSTEKISISPLGSSLRDHWRRDKKEKFCDINYLIIAKLIDLIGNNRILQNIVRKLVKIHNQQLELEKIFQLKLTKNSIFFCWIRFVLLEQMYKFLQTYSSFICKSNLIANKNKVEIQGQKFVFFKCTDLMMVKWYQNKIKAWSFQVLSKKKEILNPKNHNTFSTLNQINTCSFNKNIFSLQNETNSIHQKLFRTNSFAFKGTGGTNFSPVESSLRDHRHRDKFSKQKYFHLIKKVLQKNKIATQKQLIQILNQIIGTWDSFVINTLTKRNSLKLNRILYQLLWRWVLARHRKQRATWVKKRYWHQKNQGFVFAVL